MRHSIALPACLFIIMMSCDALIPSRSICQHQPYPFRMLFIHCDWLGLQRLLLCVCHTVPAYHPAVRYTSCHDNTKSRKLAWAARIASGHAG